MISGGCLDVLTFVFTFVFGFVSTRYTTVKSNLALYTMHNVGDKHSQSTCMSLAVALS